MLDSLATTLTTAYLRRRLDVRMLVRYVAGGRALDLVRSRADPWLEPDSPSTIGIEFTNVCQLRCPNCDAQHPDIRGPAGYMSDATLERLVTQLPSLRVRNLRVIGGGEPTLHPRFPAYLERLRGLTPFLSVTTNGQHLPAPIARAASRCLDVLEVSVAGLDAAGYARSRGGGDLTRLLANLAALLRLRDRSGSRTLVQLRVMVRPSEVPDTDRLLRFWGGHGDVVSTQRLQGYFGQTGDVFPTPPVEGAPACVLPFRMLGVAWSGDVPLCRGSSVQLRTPDGLLLGNIHDATLTELWRGAVLRQYREGHRRRRTALTPICHGCVDAQAPRWGRSYDNNPHLASPPALLPVSALTRRVGVSR